MRLLDPDNPRKHRASFEAALKEALLRTYPVAPVVEAVDDRFVQLLEKMAALELDRTGKG